MNWFRQNRWLGTFLIVFGVCTLAAIYFLYSAKSGADESLARFNEAAGERTRLERLDPFPSEPNFKKMKVHLENYTRAVDKLKEDLKTRVLPAPPLAPNEFQSHLRQAMVAVAEKARLNKVKLPDNFALGFEEFTAALPNTAAAPLLGQELAQVELVMNMLIDARVDNVGALVRTPLTEERSAVAPTPVAGAGGRRPPASAATGPKMLERAVIDVTFTSSPSAARKVLNQLGSSNQQFYITRTLHVRNDKDKGPVREAPPAVGAGVAVPAVAAAPTIAAPASGATGTAATGRAASAPALSFIVGNEHVETSARVELIRFTF